MLTLVPQLMIHFFSIFFFFFFSQHPVADDSSTGSRFTDKSISAIVDNTSAVISFKLPSILENCGNQPISCRQGTSSSSDDTDTVPLLRARCSMSTQKAPVKSTPDFRTG